MAPAGFCWLPPDHYIVVKLGALGQTQSRRAFIFGAIGAIGAVGLALACWPLIDQMNTSADSRAMAGVNSIRSGWTWA